MEVRSLLRLRHGLAWHCSTVRIGPLPHLTCHLFNKCFHISPDCLTAVAFYSCLAGRLLSVSLRWRYSSEIARQMAGWGRDRAGGDFCFSACLTVGLQPERAKLRLWRSSLTSIEGWGWKWSPDYQLAWGAFGETIRLSKTTKLILLDSLLQEVCIYSGMTDFSVVSVSHNPVLFRTDESPLNNLSQPKLELLVFSLVSVWLSSGHLTFQFSPPSDKTKRRVL